MGHTVTPRFATSDTPAPEVHALLGPTNTGKTHRAIERMLEHQTGMLGFPLRLLAREVYDRISARLGEQAVALITGEEKRVPRAPRFYVCTVEAMPLDLRTEFVGIDEIQLVAHPERGHVFTDRLLHMRGTHSTWFLGSDTARPLLQRLLPGLTVQTLPRLSQLTHTGRASLRTVPRRSAVVAFTMPAVYELADVLRVRRGGAAVVLGALSPRVRNAQVALYQAGDVDFLVATDAIGMGLNLDIDHVALASRTKFDGFEKRPLEAAELGQIVGRAGRHLRDGSFGTLSPEPELPERLVAQLESHTFPALHKAYYRNSALDYSSLPALLASLSVRPPRDELCLPPDGDDLALLRVLAKRDDVLMRAHTRDSVRLAWELCLLPNYEKLLPEHQAERVYPLFAELCEHGRIGAARVHSALARLTRFEGDIHVLMDRLSAVRTWTYVSHQHGWVDDAEALRGSTRELEDKLSDTLHERLLERFVDTTRVSRTARATASASGPFAQLSALSAHRQPHLSPRARWVENVVAAPLEALAIDAHGRLFAHGERVATLSRGPQIHTPALKLRLPDDLDGGSRSRIERRLQAHLRDALAQLRLADGSVGEQGTAMRGLAYQLTQGLGSALTRHARAQIDALDARDRALLSAHGVVFGRHSVYVSASLSADASSTRLALIRVFNEQPTALVEAEERVVFAHHGAPEQNIVCAGFVPLRSLAVRCDVLESVLATEGLAAASRIAATADLIASSEAQLAERLIAELPQRRKRRSRGRP